MQKVQTRGHASTTRASCRRPRRYGSTPDDGRGLQLRRHGGDHDVGLADQAARVGHHVGVEPACSRMSGKGFGRLRRMGEYRANPGVQSSEQIQVRPGLHAAAEKADDGASFGPQVARCQRRHGRGANRGQAARGQQREDVSAGRVRQQRGAADAPTRRLGAADTNPFQRGEAPKAARASAKGVVTPGTMNIADPPEVAMAAPIASSSSRVGRRHKPSMTGTPLRACSPM